MGPSVPLMRHFLLVQLWNCGSQSPGLNCMGLRVGVPPRVWLLAGPNVKQVSFQKSRALVKRSLSSTQRLRSQNPSRIAHQDTFDPTRDRNLQSRGAVSIGFSPVNDFFFFHFSGFLCTLARKSPQMWRKLTDVQVEKKA